MAVQLLMTHVFILSIHENPKNKLKKSGRIKSDISFISENAIWSGLGVFYGDFVSFLKLKCMLIEWKRHEAHKGEEIFNLRGIAKVMYKHLNLVLDVLWRFYYMKINQPSFT